jgi:O-acetyl-ADP-ribose deacetylase (regulator of RNase III)
MIHEVSGDILLTKARAIAHGVAPNDHFSSGLALSLRERWPAMAKDFRHYCHTAHPKPGAVWIWRGPTGSAIVNLMTQDTVPDDGKQGGKAHVETVNHALRGLRKLIEDEKLDSVALPKLATAAGGLHWADVYPLIKQHLSDLSIPVLVYTTFHKGVAADEKLG